MADLAASREANLALAADLAVDVRPDVRPDVGPDVGAIGSPAVVPEVTADARPGAAKNGEGDEGMFADGMWIFYLEALLALVLGLFIVWWTMPKKRPPAPLAHKMEQPGAANVAGGAGTVGTLPGGPISSAAVASGSSAAGTPQPGDAGALPLSDAMRQRR